MLTAEPPPDGQASASDFDFFDDVDSEVPIPLNRLLSTATPPVGPQHRRLEQLRTTSSTRATRSSLKRPQEAAAEPTSSTKKAKTVTSRQSKRPIVLDDSEDDPSTDEDDEIPPDERLQNLEGLSAADTSSVCMYSIIITLLTIFTEARTKSARQG